MEKSKLEILFDSEDAKQHFISWLCGQGEQYYWDWMECREQEEDGDITAIDFDYHGGTQNGKEFGKHTVIAKCGRLKR
ncbi:hypothetical protein UFOVP1290_411 [uncultured Caudovirales phage]|uniref:Uncharacterized protein n=1 Tax=uncultured Caudovirales phage TaxID=2100421 RepID=A0A6J5RTJ8_9CAUD|nr:hypothetical protein UFOVP1290_411 [uncultured Caudovirales phage]